MKRVLKASQLSLKPFRILLLQQPSLMPMVIISSLDYALMTTESKWLLQRYRQNMLPVLYYKVLMIL